jgi:hypothetical protein
MFCRTHRNDRAPTVTGAGILAASFIRRIVFGDNRSSRAMSASVMVNGNGPADGFPFGGIPPRSKRRGGDVAGFDCRIIFKAGLPNMGHPAFPAFPGPIIRAAFLHFLRDAQQVFQRFRFPPFAGQFHLHHFNARDAIERTTLFRS